MEMGIVPMAEVTYALLLIFAGALAQWALARIGASPRCDLDTLEHTQKALIKANNRVIQCQAALLKIARWHGEFPPAFGRDGKPSSYGLEYGSNGERDYMRQIALNAVKSCGN